MKYSQIKDEKYYDRGRDYPAYAKSKTDNNHVKMSMTMPGKEVKFWFTELELEDYPQPNAYTGPLP